MKVESDTSVVAMDNHDKSGVRFFFANYKTGKAEGAVQMIIFPEPKGSLNKGLGNCSLTQLFTSADDILNRAL